MISWLTSLREAFQIIQITIGFISYRKICLLVCFYYLGDLITPYSKILAQALLVIRAIENKKITRWILIKRYFWELFLKSMGAEMKLWWCEDSTSKTLKMHLKMIIRSFPFNEILIKEKLENAILLMNNSFFKH